MGDFFGLGSLTGAGVQAAGAVQARRQSVSDTRHGRQWQEMMANTAYQRTVADMKAAGLNPALAFGGGSANPQGAPQTQLPDVFNPGAGMADAMSRVVSSATQGAKLKTEMNILKEQEEKTRWEAHGARANALWAPDLADAAVKERLGNASLMSQQANESRARTIGSGFDNTLKKADAEFYGTEFGQKMRATERFLDSVGGLGRFSVGPPRRKGGSTNETIHKHYREPGRAPRQQ